MKKVLAIVWLSVGGAFTCGALIHCLLMMLGMYHPVSHDSLPPESFPWYLIEIVGFPILYIATIRSAFRVANT